MGEHDEKGEFEVTFQEHISRVVAEKLASPISDQSKEVIERIEDA